MAEFVVNPRRSPRAPVRCRAQVITAQGPLEAETEDLSAHGVQVVVSRELRRGEIVRVSLSHRAVREPLEVPGKVSWTSPQAPWRTGIAFDEAACRQSKRWYERLVEALPGMPSLDRVPDRIALDAAVFLGPPPRFVLDFTPDEAIVLRAIGSGSTLDDLRIKLRDRWVPSQRALFSLIARHHVTLVRGEGVHPDAWKKILAELESSQALAELAPALTPAPVPAATPAPAAPSPAVPASRPPGRSAEAQECLDRGLAEIGRGQIHAGVALLRRAATLAPGDAEITTALWKASSSAASSRR